VAAVALHDGLVARGLDVLDQCAGSTLSACSVRGARTSEAWVWLTILGGLLLALSGALVAARGRRWAALSSSYQPPAARAAEPPATDKGVWDALDRGEDPPR